jgi:hypothetical protein
VPLSEEERLSLEAVRGHAERLLIVLATAPHLVALASLPVETLRLVAMLLTGDDSAS